MPASESPEYRRLAAELAQAQAQATRQLEAARHRRQRSRPARYRSDPRTWVLKWALIPACALIMVVTGANRFGPALAAAEGHGTPGYFVATTENCSKDGCSWAGHFMTADGRIILRDVGLKGPQGPMYPGDRIAALDTGADGAVFTRHGERNWMADLALIVAGAIAFGLWSWRVPWRTARRRLVGYRLEDWHSVT